MIWMINTMRTLYYGLAYAGRWENSAMWKQYGLVEEQYFRISHGRDKNKLEKLSLLLISRGAPHKVRYQSLKFDCKCYITPFIFLFNYIMALLDVILPI